MTWARLPTSLDAGGASPRAGNVTGQTINVDGDFVIVVFARARHLAATGLLLACSLLWVGPACAEEVDAVNGRPVTIPGRTAITFWTEPRSDLDHLPPRWQPRLQPVMR